VESKKKQQKAFNFLGKLFFLSSSHYKIPRINMKQQQYKWQKGKRKALNEIHKSGRKTPKVLI